MKSKVSNIRPNVLGDYPKIHPTALIDPTAQIIGNVEIGKNVFVAPLVVIRSDEPGPDGKVWPIIIDEESNIQDGVIIHSQGGAEVFIGAKTSVAHGAIIHGPCQIKEGCFLAMRCTLYNANLESCVWVGVNATIMKVTLDAFTYVPPGSQIRSRRQAWDLRLVTEKEQKYMKAVLHATNRLREDYKDMLNMQQKITDSA